MTNSMISTAFKYCFSGYGQFIVFVTKVEAKNYIKNNPTIYRIKDLLTITDELREKISSIKRDQVFEVIDSVATPMEIEMIDPVEESKKVWWDDATKSWISIDEAVAKANCPNCADQASIAAPGQTTLCKTHSDEKHYADMKEFFDENIQEIFFYIHLPFCSRCGKNNPEYILLIQHEKHKPSNFAVCTNCRDELTLKKNAAIAALERIGT